MKQHLQADETFGNTHCNDQSVNTYVQHCQQIPQTMPEQARQKKLFTNNDNKGIKCKIKIVKCNIGS